MTSKKDLLFQKGLQLQALNEQVTSSTTTSTTSKITSGKQARELAKVRELCPNGTDDDVLLQLLAQTKGDQAKMEQAVSELWENHRGGGNDEWATVEKKGKKKTESTYVSSRGGRDGAPRRDRPAYNKPQDSDGNPAGDDSETTDRSAGGRGGRGSVRGRGAPAARGGRGGGRGRGRGATPQSATTGEGDDNTDDNTETAEGDAANNNKVGSSGKGQRKDAPPTKSAETQPAVVTPTPVIPGLTGAWTKKPNLVGLVQQPKPAEPPKPAAQQPAPADKQPVAAKPATPATASPASKPAPAPVASPAAKPSPAPVAAASPAAAVASPQKAPVASSPKKVASPKPIEKVASPKAAPESKPLEQPTISAWGSLDVSTTTIGDWTSTTTTVTEKKTVQTPNAWARGSPITNIATDAKSPATTAASAATVASPRDQSLSAGAIATSPKYLKLGRWETGVSANLSLQFGSFSLNGVEQHTEASSPRGWASATTTTTTMTAKTTTKAEAPNAWGTQPAQSPKKKALSPAPRKNESEDRKTTSAPPGLSVESGRLTPKSAQSPRTFAPSAPSPASLPKPDDVKRTTPTHSQGGPFQGGSQASAKIGSGSTYASDFGGKSSSIYQATYGQYAMGLGASTNQSNTPKSGNARNNATTAGAVPSPTHGAQSAPAQYQPQSQQPQPQQKPAQQQAQQAQGAQPHPHQGHGHAHQNIPPHHQAGPPGYHPHYAPPPPPGIPMGYNPYNYAGYYQGYPYYQNPQYAQYSPRAQYPPRGSVPYGVEGPIPGFASGPNVPYQDQHLHDYPGAIPQGFGEISGAYLNQPGHHHHGHQQSGPQSHGKNQNQGSASAQQPRSGGSGFQGYQSSGNSRDHGATSGVANPSTNVNAASAAASYSQQQQHYGWASYGAQPMGGWGHMVPQGYQQQNPSQHAHQQSYRQYSSNNTQGGNASSEGSGVGSSHGTHSHAWSS